jgi:peptide/nickel transport system substrate-binding protein
MSGFKRVRAVYVIVAVLILALVSACGGGGAAPGGGSSSGGSGGSGGGSGGQADAGRGGDIVMTVPAGAETLDPAVTINQAAQGVFRNIYEPLVGPSMDGGFEGILAERWEASEGGAVWTFFLREGVVFSNGNPLNADAVVFTFNRFLDPDNPSPLAGQLGPVVSVDKVDEMTVKFTLAMPYALLLDNIANAYFGILDPAAVAQYGDDYGRNPVGTGPWMLDDWVTGDRIVLVPNEKHKDFRTHVTNKGAPLADRLIFREIGQVDTQLAALETGDVNIVTTVPADRLAQYRNRPEYTIFSQPVDAITYLSFGMEAQEGGTNTFKAPFDDIRVRQAVGYAMDIAPIIDNVFEGLVLRNKSPMPPGVFAHDPSVNGFDPNVEKAKALLEDAGWKAGADGVREKNGQQLAVEFWIMSEATFEAVAQVLQSQLAQVGMKVNITALDPATFISRVATSDMQMELMQLGWPAPNILDIAATVGWGFGLYNNPDLMGALGEAVTTTDTDARRQLYERAQHIIVDDTAMIPLWTPSTATIVSGNVKGIKTDRQGQLVFEDAYVTK